MTGCPNTLCFCPRLRHRAAAARERLNIKRGEYDLLLVERWVAFHNFLWSCSLAQHVRYELYWNARATIDREPRIMSGSETIIASAR